MSLRGTIKKLQHRIGDWLGTDAALRRHLQEVPFEPVGNVHVDSIFYQDGMNPLRLNALEISRRYSPEYEHLWRALRHNFNDLIVWQQEENVGAIPLSDLTGLMASKSRGPWKTLEEFGRSNACRGIPCSSDDDFQRNMAHSFPKNHQPFSVWKVWWNGRTYWMNNDGSHHAAVAYVQALEQGRKVSIPCTVTHVRVDEARATEIVRYFAAIVIASRTMDRLWRVLARFGVPFQYARYTPAGDHLSLLLLPRSSRKAMLVAEIIMGITSEGEVFEFTQFLRDSILIPPDREVPLGYTAVGRP